MRFSIGILVAIGVLAFSSTHAQNPNQSAGVNDSQVRPPSRKPTLKIDRHARQILNSVAKWNREDNRICPADAKKFSLYCALEKATGRSAATSNIAARRCRSAICD